MILKLLYIILGIVYCHCHRIQKCCDYNQKLASNFSSCTSFDGERDPARQLKPVPVNNVTKVILGHLHTCSKEERAAVSFNNRAFLLDSGALLAIDVFDNRKPKTMVFPYESFCLDQVSLNDHNERNSTTNLNLVILLCPCSILPCVQMCCPRNIPLNVNSWFEECQHSSEGLPKGYSNCAEPVDNIFNEKFEMIRGVPTCKNGYYYNDDSSVADPKAKFNILTNGNITIEEQVVDVSSNEYCVHYSNVGGKFDTNLQYCKVTATRRQSEKMNFQGMLYIAYFIIGSFFLAATLMMYALVVELRETMYASLLMNHVACLFVCYAMMAAERILLPTLCSWRCILIGHIIQFFFIAAIFWLNTMCVYISRNFRSIKTVKTPRPKNKFQYVRYSTYVWGSALTITTATFLVDYNMLFSEEMRPRFGFKVCWFAGYWAKFWYFYLPITIVLFANLILFIFTVKKILTMQNESRRILSRESKKHVGNKLVAQQSNKLMRYTKLFALMGITWIFEVLSWAVEGPDWFWYLTDAINALRGVFIFVVCCCKKKFFQQLFDQLREKSKSGASHSQRSASLRDRSSDAATDIGCNLYQMVVVQNSTKPHDPKAIDSN